MLHANQGGMVAYLPEGMNQVLAVIIQTEAPVGQPYHATTMGRLSGQQTGPAGRTGWGSAKSLPEQRAFLGQALQIWGRDRMTIGLNITSRVMRVDIKNVRVLHYF
jgi:hypothetical protein